MNEIYSSELLNYSISSKTPDAHGNSHAFEEAT